MVAGDEPAGNRPMQGECNGPDDIRTVTRVVSRIRKSSKNRLTNASGRSIVRKVVRAADSGKQVIRLTLARVSDPGTYRISRVFLCKRQMEAD